MHKILFYIPEGLDEPSSFIDMARTRFPEEHSVLATNEDVCAAEIVDADAIITWGVKLNDGLIRKAQRLRWIHSLITGYDWLSNLPSLGPETMVTRTRIYGHPMAEMALMMMLALSRDLPGFLRNQREHVWERWKGRLLYGKTVGILGIGAIGEALARKLKGMEMTVIGISETPREIDAIDRFVPRSRLVEVAAELDFLVVVVPLSVETRHIVNSEVFEAMKQTAFLVNIARGDVVDEAALLQALLDGAIAGAGLDVFATEPLPADNPLWDMPNVIVTPHCGGGGDNNLELMLNLIEHNTRCFVDRRYDEMIDRVR